MEHPDLVLYDVADFRIAAGAKFTTAFSRRGLIAEYGLAWHLASRRTRRCARRTDRGPGRVHRRRRLTPTGLTGHGCRPVHLNALRVGVS